MIRKYFLASNSANGFFSLYGAFPPGGAYLHVIKGGPGTGKSSFMRSIGEAAEKRGHSVEYVLCSGDPASLDGVYIPALKAAWMDGTAPHTAEPKLFGVDGDYVNLGRFCGTPLSADDAQEAARLNRINKAEYAAAYRILAEAQKNKSALLSAQNAPRRLFLSAVSRGGKMSLYEELSDYNAIMTAQKELDDIASDMSASSECVFCLDPLLPGSVEAIVIPKCRTVIRALTDDGTADGIVSRASEHIRAAGLAHDELEKIYKKYMDYGSLNDFTTEYLSKLFYIM